MHFTPYSKFINTLIPRLKNEICSSSPSSLSVRIKRPTKDKYKGLLGFCIANDF